MKDQIRYIKKESDAILFQSISEYMKGHFDIEDVMADPAFEDIHGKVMTEIKLNNSGNLENEKFVREAFAQADSDRDVVDEIKTIQEDLADNNLNELTADWVREWHERKQKIGSADPKAEEIRYFVSESIKAENSVIEINLNSQNQRRKMSSVFIRYSLMIAAALTGVIILLKTLIPASDPGKLFDTNYMPFNAISPVTRGTSNIGDLDYSKAIAEYKAGDYKEAADKFSSNLLASPASSSNQFYLGLSLIALSNYTEAIKQLSELKDSPEYAKDAKWYMGLSYLKIADTQKAAECFRSLASSGGFYKERSEKILRFLK